MTQLLPQQVPEAGLANGASRSVQQGLPPVLRELHVFTFVCVVCAGDDGHLALPAVPLLGNETVGEIVVRCFVVIFAIAL